MMRRLSSEQVLSIHDERGTCSRQFDCRTTGSAVHELSIAHSIVSTAVAAANDAGVTEVQSVSLKLGELSGVVDDALLFGYEVASTGTILEGTRLDIERVKARIWCDVCSAERELAAANRFRCVECDTPSARLVAGRELQLVGLEYSS